MAVWWWWGSLTCKIVESNTVMRLGGKGKAKGARSKQLGGWLAPSNRGGAPHASTRNTPPTVGFFWLISANCSLQAPRHAPRALPQPPQSGFLFLDPAVNQGVNQGVNQALNQAVHLAGRRPTRAPASGSRSHGRAPASGSGSGSRRRMVG